MLELTPIENTMIGNEEVSGLSFEQKKRVSIAVELAANPSVLFLDEPTTGLDSRAAQVVIRCIKRVASSGRTVVCTIHQPSAVIFEAFDSLLLLRRGGQTVYFGELGEHSCHMVSYLEGVPNVSPRQPGTNPSTWMLEVIGAGTSGGANANVIDFHAYYLQSALCAVNTARVDALVTTALSPADLESGNLVVVKEGTECGFVPVLCGTVHDLLPDGDAIPAHTYNASYVTQFRVLMYRFLLAYWRSPTYNFVRMVVSVVIALIFSSTYADQKYTTNVDVIARVAVVYVTLLFMGIVGMKSVQPVILEERPAFYRELYYKMYDTKLYVVAGTLVEVTCFSVVRVVLRLKVFIYVMQIPYLLLSSLMFVIPFFFIVGFDNGDVTAKFFYYWLFQSLYVSLMVFLGHLLSTALSTAAVGNGKHPAHAVGPVCASLTEPVLLVCLSSHSGWGHAVDVHLAVLRLPDSTGGLRVVLAVHVLAGPHALRAGGARGDAVPPGRHGDHNHGHGVHHDGERLRANLLLGLEVRAPRLRGDGATALHCVLQVRIKSAVHYGLCSLITSTVLPF
jgi:energy-coupling factor transporter ATP-binding protein EcfA2